MAGPMDKVKLQGILVQAKLGAITAHVVRDGMLQLQARLQAHTTTGTATNPGGSGGVAPPAASEDVTGTNSGGAGAGLPSKVGVTDTTTTTTTTAGGATPGNTGEARSLEDEILSSLFDVYMGLETVARYMTSCLTMAAKSGVPPSLPARFATISDERLYEELLALRLPEPPTTQRHAFARLEAALYAVKLPQEHHLERCGHYLRRPAAQRRMRLQARNYFGRACTSASLAATHIDLAVTLIESFVDPQDVANISDFANRTANRDLSQLYR